MKYSNLSQFLNCNLSPQMLHFEDINWDEWCIRIIQSDRCQSVTFLFCRNKNTVSWQLIDLSPWEMSLLIKTHLDWWQHIGNLSAKQLFVNWLQSVQVRLWLFTGQVLSGDLCVPLISKVQLEVQQPQALGNHLVTHVTEPLACSDLSFALSS